MGYFYDDFKIDHLEHHGIKGQKWGVRRFQNSDGSLTSAGKQRAQNNRNYKKTVEEYKKSGKAYVENLDSYEVGELTTMTTKSGEKYISGLINGHDFDWQEVNKYDDGKYHTVSDTINQFPDAFKTQGSEDNSIHSRHRYSSNDLEQCNPGFGEPGTTQNCSKNAAAMEMRMRGYDVSAGRQTYPSSSDAESLWFKGAERIDYDSDSVESALKSYGPGTSGTISIRYPNGSGHCMHWTNTIEDDGTSYFGIADGQNGRGFDSVEDMMNTYGADKSAKVTTFRLDNCEPNLEAMAQDSVLRLHDGSDKVYNKFQKRYVDTW